MSEAIIPDKETTPTSTPIQITSTTTGDHTLQLQGLKTTPTSHLLHPTEQEFEEDGSEGWGGGGVGEEGVRDDLESVVGLDPVHEVANHLLEDLLVHAHCHHGELGAGREER